MSKLSFRARALDPSKPMPIYLAEDLPDLPEYSAINRAVPQMPSGMEKEEESEHHLQRAICAGLIIPTPEVFKIDKDEYDKNYPPNYKMPRQLIHMQSLGLEQDTPDYDMDSGDEFWVLSQMRRLDLTALKFEQMMDRLEKSSGQTVVTLNEAKALLKQDDDVSIAVYDYWLNKRLKMQHPLILSVKTEDRSGAAPNNPYLAFRKRTEKMQTRKNRKNDEASYEKMLKLRRDLSRAVALLEFVKKREKLKREQVQLSIDIVEKRFQGRDFSGSLLTELTLDIKNSRPSAFAPIYSNQYSHHSAIPHAGLLPSPTSSAHHHYSTSQYLNSTGMVTASSSVGATKRDLDSGSRKEKRQYKKRKHKLQRDKQFQTQIASPAAIESTVSSDEEDMVSNHLGGGSEGEDEGLFPFRRNKNCDYHKPIVSEPGNWPWEKNVDNGLTDPKYRFTLTSLRHPRTRCIGFARRRLGRGGRVIIDRMSTDMDDIWSKLDYTIFESKGTSSISSDSCAATKEKTYNEQYKENNLVSRDTMYCSSSNDPLESEIALRHRLHSDSMSRRPISPQLLRNTNTYNNNSISISSNNLSSSVERNSINNNNNNINNNSSYSVMNTNEKQEIMDIDDETLLSVSGMRTGTSTTTTEPIVGVNMQSMRSNMNMRQHQNPYDTQFLSSFKRETQSPLSAAVSPSPSPLSSSADVLDLARTHWKNSDLSSRNLNVNNNNYNNNNTSNNANSNHINYTTDNLRTISSNISNEKVVIKQEITNTNSSVIKKQNDITLMDTNNIFDDDNVILSRLSSYINASRAASANMVIDKLSSDNSERTSTSIDKIQCKNYIGGDNNDYKFLNVDQLQSKDHHQPHQSQNDVNSMNSGQLINSNYVNSCIKLDKSSSISMESDSNNQMDVQEMKRDNCSGSSTIHGDNININEWSEFLQEVRNDWLHFRPKTPTDTKSIELKQRQTTSNLTDSPKILSGENSQSGPSTEAAVSVDKQGSGGSSETIPISSASLNKNDNDEKKDITNDNDDEALVNFSEKTKIALELQRLGSSPPSSVFMSEPDKDPVFVTNPFSYADMLPDDLLLTNNNTLDSLNSGLDLNFSGDSEFNLSIGEDDSENMLDNILQECEIDDMKTLSQTTQFWNVILDDGGLLDVIDEKKTPIPDLKDHIGYTSDFVLNGLTDDKECKKSSKKKHSQRLKSYYSKFCVSNTSQNEKFFSKEDEKSDPPPLDNTTDDISNPPPQQQTQIQSQIELQTQTQPATQTQTHAQTQLHENSILSHAINGNNKLSLTAPGSGIVVQTVSAGSRAGLTVHGSSANGNTNINAMRTTPKIVLKPDHTQQVHSILNQQSTVVGSTIGTSQNTMIQLGNLTMDKDSTVMNLIGHSLSGGTGSGNVISATGDILNVTGNVNSTIGVQRTPLIVTQKPQQQTHSIQHSGQQQQHQHILLQSIPQSQSTQIINVSNSGLTLNEGTIVLTQSSNPGGNKRHINGPSDRNAIQNIFKQTKYMNQKFHLPHQQTQGLTTATIQSIRKQEDDGSGGIVRSIVKGPSSAIHHQQTQIAQATANYVKMSAYPMVATASDLNVQQQNSVAASSVAIASNHNYSLQPSAQPITIIGQQQHGNKIILNTSNTAAGSRVVSGSNFTIAPMDMQSKLHFNQLPTGNIKLNVLTVDAKNAELVKASHQQQQQFQQQQHQQQQHHQHQHQHQHHQQQLQRTKQDNINKMSGVFDQNTRRLLYTKVVNIQQKNNSGLTQTVQTLQAPQVGGGGSVGATAQILNKAQLAERLTVSTMRTLSIGNQIVATAGAGVNSVVASGSGTGHHHHHTKQQNNNANDSLSVPTVSGGINLNTTNR